MSKRVLIFGDTGGHGVALMSSLLHIGLDRATYKLPTDVTIIHVGDLIHKGPHSNQLISLVNAIIQANPGQWIQLLGNHEAQHIPGAPYFWRCDCSEDTIDTIRNWWQNGQAKVAHSIDPSAFAYANKPSVNEQEMLFTHSGITYAFWNKLWKPATAAETVDKINSMPVKELFKAGTMLSDGWESARTGRVPQPGPVWALSTFEVFQSWNQQGVVMPFAQVHGHTTAFGWMSKRWWPTPDGFVQHTRLDKVNRVSFTDVGKSMLIGVDPGFSERIDVDEQPFFELKT